MDEDLRALERRLSGSDDPADAGRLLLARSRAGALPRERLALAAHAGDPAAVVALGPPPEDARAWVRGLWSWGPAAVGRALVAVAALELPGWEAARDAEEPALVAWLAGVGLTAATAVAAAEAWLVCPCVTHASMALLERDVAAPTAAGAALNFVAANLRPPFAAAPAAVEIAADRVHDAIAARGPDAVRAAVAREVGGWALGDLDPLAARAPLWARLPEPWIDRWAVERPGDLERLARSAEPLAPTEPMA